MTHSKHPPVSLAWIVWGLAACLYLFGFFQRVAPGVMTSELSLEFGLTAAALGNLSAFYFYSYVAMQIPTGILADVWGPRRLLITGALVSSLGSLLFAFATDASTAGLGRLLIGASVSVAFVCMLKLANHWFLPRQFALVTGMALFIGVIGAVFAGVPLHLAVEAWGWRSVMALAAVFPVVVALGIFLLVRNDPSEKGYASHVSHEPPADNRPWKHAMLGLIEVFRYRNTWLLTIVPGGIVGSVLAFSGLWGVPFLHTHHAMSEADAAAVCSALLITLAISSPICGALSDRIGRRKPIYVVGCGIVALGWSLVVLFPAMEHSLLIGLLLVTGCASGSMIVSFAFAKESVPARQAGTVSGVVNMGVMMGPMILQPAIGWMLDRNWQGEMLEGIKIYGLPAYQAGFALMAAWTLASFLLILFTKETARTE